MVERHPSRIVAARLHAYAPGRLPPFDNPALIRHLLKTTSDFGLAMQLHFEPRYSPQLEPYIKEFPRTTVVIDYLGRPFQGTPAEHSVVVDWSRFPSTVMKVSSLRSQDQYPHRTIGPIIKSLTEPYGAERMIYGGGFNSIATERSYIAHRGRVKGYLDHHSTDDQAKILGETATKLYGLTKKAE